MGKKILIIDDEPDIVEFLSYNFVKNGFEVIRAVDGKDGIVKAESANPDIIVSDILMPELNGIEMCKVLRNRNSFRNTPFIFLSAVHDDYQVMHAMLSGADQYISKPIRFEYLLNMVNEMLGEKASA
ncbi:MAG TPA: response regulator [Bacteroidia bacterium]|jgi:two-component system alkaline phosphatase synthesis response regulator PhoP